MWLDKRPQGWLDGICWAVLDLSEPCRQANATMLPVASQVADPFHIVKLASRRLGGIRRPVQHETLCHRSRKRNPLAPRTEAC